MTLRTRSSVRRAFLALPFQIRQCRRSTSDTITAFACIRPGVSVDNPLAACSRVAAPHGDVKPIGDRWLLATGLGQHRPEARGTVRERSQLGVGGSADCLKAAPDHHYDLRLGLRHSAEYLSTAAGSLDVADANLQMPLAGMAAADEGRVYSDSDRRHGSRRLD
jgi:hypothetical protein